MPTGPEPDEFGAAATGVGMEMRRTREKGALNSAQGAEKGREVAPQRDHDRAWGQG
jgi:hypothetical protein